MVEISQAMQSYFKDLETGCFEAFKIATAARKKHLDPVDFVEINLAKNMAERVIGLVSSVAPQLIGAGVEERIKELEKQYDFLDFRVAMQLGLEVARQKFCAFKSEQEAMEVGIRVGFCYMTLGAVSAPLEGFTKLDIKKRRDGKGDYFCLNYSGPVRGAGGKAAAVSVLIADYIRNSFNYSEYDPDEKEVQRCHAELEDYHQFVTNLQYFPSKAETEFLMRHVPVEISGDPSEKYDLSNINLRNLPRVPVNRLRNGFCLIHSACLPLKAPKLLAALKKWAKDFNMEHWMFLEEFVEIQKKQKAKGDIRADSVKIKPDYTYITDIVAGRPIFGMPLKPGGFRLRYGRCRTSGYSAMSIHPATTFILNSFLATATQLKVERPGKATAITTCNTINGPIVRLKDGSVLQIADVEQAKKYTKDVEKILYVGDMLACYGDFFDRAHVLAPPGYSPEFWILELEKFVVDTYGTFDLERLSYDVEVPLDILKRLFAQPLKTAISFDVALKIATRTGTPLHPEFTFFWPLINVPKLKGLVSAVGSSRREESDGEIKKLIFPLGKHKDTLEVLGIPHLVVTNEFIVVRGDFAKALHFTLGFADKDAAAIISAIDFETEHPQTQVRAGILSLLEKISGIRLRDKAGLFIGARMARPEKAKHRKMTGSPNALFPVGNEGGKLRSFNSALAKGHITADFRVFYCTHCNRESCLPVCYSCLKHCEPRFFCEQCGYISEKCDHEHKVSKQMVVPTKSLFDSSLKLLKTNIFPDLIKGVRGTSNREHYPEFLAKGFLRAKHNLCVNKDGTIRYDCSEVPITHFKPKEIGVSVEQVKSLGYDLDIRGSELTDADQVLELKPQDILLPCCDDAPDEPADEIFFRTAKFIDDELTALYSQKPYYNLKSKEELVGHYILALAPHTSAATLCRIIGFSKTQGFFAHPMIHAAMRRDCDGDEGCFILLMDAFLNFSRKYLPSSRGSTMDAPFVLTYNINPAEVDDMYLNLDVVWKYPLSFYQAALDYKMPWEVNIKRVGNVLGTEDQFENIGFTHDTDNINDGVLCSDYKLLPSMEEKLNSQMDLAEKISAVDSSFVAALVIEKHFIRDTKGNLKKFSMQQFRCVDCNEKFRRPPLSGKCSACSGKIIFTISEGSIVKYLDKSLAIAKKYQVSNYLQQTLELLKSAVESIFGTESEKQENLAKWVG